MSGRFEEKSALVTGAASGIGLAITRQILNEGGRVAGSDINSDLLQHVAKDLGPRFAPLAGDVTKETDAEAARPAAWGSVPRSRRRPRMLTAAR